MARIGLIEIRSAYHGLAGMCKISNTPKNRVTVFTTRALFPRVAGELDEETSEYEWILDEEGESAYSYVKRIERICNDSIDLVIIETFRHWQFAFFRPKCKVLARLFNLNFWFRDTKDPSVILRRMIDWRNVFTRNVAFNAITGPIARRVMLSHLDGVIVEYAPFKSYLYDHFGYRGNVYFFPLRPFEAVVGQRSDDKIRFTVPGTIDELRRDYRIVMRVFEGLFEKHGDAVELYLLGKPVDDYGESILAHCESLQERGFTVHCSKAYVPPTMFEEIMADTDVVLSPMQLRYRSGIVDEVYTVTKGTGIFSDVIKHAKPVVVPHTYNLTDEITNSFLTYRDEEELRTLLGDLIEDAEKLEGLKKAAVRTSELFSLHRLRESFDRMVEEVLGR